jgi:hypothetical protein
MSSTDLVAKLRIRENLQLDIDFDKKLVNIWVNPDPNACTQDCETPDELKIMLAWAAARLLEAGAEMSAAYNDRSKADCLMESLQDLMLMLQSNACRAEGDNVPEWWSATRGTPGTRRRAAAHE